MIAKEREPQGLVLPDFNDLISISGNIGFLNGELQRKGLSENRLAWLKEMEATRHLYFKSIFERRARGEVDFKVSIVRDSHEKPHPFSRNRIELRFDGLEKTVKTSVNFIAAGGQMGTSADVIKLIKEGKNTKLVEEKPNSFLLRTFAEIEDVQNAALENNQADRETTELKNLNASLMVRLLRLRLKQLHGLLVLPLSVYYTNTMPGGELSITVRGLDSDHNRTFSSKTITTPLHDLIDTTSAGKITKLFVDIKNEEASLLSQRELFPKTP